MLSLLFVKMTWIRGRRQYVRSRVRYLNGAYLRAEMAGGGRNELYKVLQIMLHDNNNKVGYLSNHVG